MNFAFSSRAESKLRPALVVQSDPNTVRPTNTVAVQIASKLRRLHEPTRLLVGPSAPAGAGSGFRNLPIQQVDECWKAALGPAGL